MNARQFLLLLFVMALIGGMTAVGGVLLGISAFCSVVLVIVVAVGGRSERRVLVPHPH